MNCQSHMIQQECVNDTRETYARRFRMILVVWHSANIGAKLFRIRPKSVAFRLHVSSSYQCQYGFSLNKLYDLIKYD